MTNMIMTCSGCGKPMRVPSNAVGREVLCPACNRITVARAEKPASVDAANPYGSATTTATPSASQHLFQSPIAASAMEVERFVETRLPPSRTLTLVPGVLLCAEAVLALSLHTVSYLAGTSNIFSLVSDLMYMSSSVFFYLYQIVILLGGIALIRQRNYWAARTAAVLVFIPVVLLSVGWFLVYGLLIYLIGLIGGVGTLNALASIRAYESYQEKTVNTRPDPV